MRMAIALAYACLCVSVAPARAGGVSLNWGTACFSEAPHLTQTFACNTNSGQWWLTPSFAVDDPGAPVVAVEVELAGHGFDAFVVPWWHVGRPPDCRSGYVSVGSEPVASEVCTDWFVGHMVHGQYTYSPPWDRDMPSRLWMSLALLTPEGVPLEAGTEYTGPRLLVRNGRTVGAGQCLGCDHFLQWRVVGITLVGEDGSRRTLTDRMPGGYEIVHWQYPYDVPVAPTTWGMIKGLYR